MAERDELQRVPARVTVHVRGVSRWRTRLRGVRNMVLPSHDGRPNPVVLGRTVYCVSFSPGIAWALDASTGDVKWRTKLGRYAGPTLLITRRDVFAKSSTELFCLRRRDGQIRWTYRPYETGGESIYSSPVVHGDDVIIADRRGTAHAVTASNGVLHWRAEVGAGSSVNTTAAFVGGTLVFGTNGGEAVGVAAEDGLIRWRTRLDAPCIAAPRVLGTTVAMYTDETVFWLRARDGCVLARWSTGKRRIRSFGVVGARVLVVASDDETTQLVVLDHGKVRREFAHPGFAMSDGLRYEASRDVVLDARIMGLGILDPRTYARLVEVEGFGEPLGTPTSTRATTFVAEGRYVHAIDNRIITKARSR